MLSGVQPCFQLLRIGSSNNANGQGSDVADLALFRLGRAVELCDVYSGESSTVSRIHAELHAERQTDGVAGEGWKVQVKDRSSYGTWVNDVRIQQGVLWEIFDGDTLTFGGQSVRGNPEFYFLFQKVRVRPQDFDAITVPKASSFSSDIQNRIRTSLDSKPEPSLDLSKLSINRATVILNSIGSLSKMNGSCWTFKRTDKTTDLTSTRTPSFTALVPPSTPPPLPSRRKSAHTVLLEDDSSDDPPCLPAPRGRRRTNSSPVYSPLVVGGVNYHLASPSMRLTKVERERGQGVEPCAAVHCRLPQQDTVQWVQCDDCDAWYHLDCLPHDRNQASFLVDPSADFHCGCC
uniref:FHA domain-containing protein n=1 Tax=Electrophorus electricus TaxID=8005 RepID=A0AAY5EGI6_ELEEL